MTYRVGKWPTEERVEMMWRPFPQPVKRLGNHRACIRFDGEADAVRVCVPWRRRDRHPEQKAVILVDAAECNVIQNLIRVNMNREYGDFVFEPWRGVSDYYLYFMPFEITGLWAFPTITYLPPADTADLPWIEQNYLSPDALAAGRWQELPEAEVTAFEARSEFDRFTEMEIIATEAEVAELLRQAGDTPCLLFPEDRRFPIRMIDDLPERWLRNGPSQEFRGQADRGEFYTFQIGVFALHRTVEVIGIKYSALKSRWNSGHVIPESRFRCFNFGGTDWLGRRFTRTVQVQAGKVQPLWFGVDIPGDIESGEYKGSVTLLFHNAPDATVRLTLDVGEELVPHRGDADLWRHTRLRWLDSTIGIEDAPTRSYPPIEVEGTTVRCLGRLVTFGDTGLPTHIQSLFSESVDCILQHGGREILAAPMQMVVKTADRRAEWSGGHAQVVETTPGTAVIEACNTSGRFTLSVCAKMEFDGYTNFSVTVAASQPADVTDICLEISLRRDVAVYMMGLGHKGGRRVGNWDWKWNEKYANNNFWIGDVNAGLHCNLKWTTDVWELCNLKATGIPESWGNQGQGGCTVTEENERVVVRVFSGLRHIIPEQPVLFRFGMLPTPVKPLNQDHWHQRYCHEYHVQTEPGKTAKELHARIINIHQGGAINPYINYPFLTVAALGDFVAEAHRHGVKVKIYYTIRELSNHVYEIWALRSLGNEVFLDGPGFRLAAQCFPEDVDRQANGWAWLQEHLADYFIPAWHQPLPDGDWDAAIATSGLSRWHNYYLEGLAWLIREVGIDGLYLDGIGYDREVMKRVRRTMDSERQGCLIDFHSGNSFGEEYGLNSPACRYLEHFPYLDSLWFGEGFDPNESPDYWLVEMSGIPFGLFSEMLQDGGNPWRGMLYGMTCRLKWSGDPRPIWQLWDKFGIQEARMLGYWTISCPVRTSHKDVLATVYAKEGRALIALASWAKDTVRCRLSIDFGKLGMDSSKVRLSAPTVEGLQEDEIEIVSVNDELAIQPGGGRLLIIEHLNSVAWS